MAVKSMLWLASLAGLLALAGCDAQPRPADACGRVFYQDSNLEHFIRVERVESDRIGDGLLRVRMDIRNRGKEPIWVDAQVVWKDETGFEKSKTPWESIFLEPRYCTTRQFNSLGADVSDYQVRLRKPAKSVGP